MKPWGYASLMCYTIGLPVTFAGILFYHRTEIRADQVLRAKDRGNTAITNPNFDIRQRYQELYR